MNRLVFRSAPASQVATLVTDGAALQERFDDYRGDESKLRCARLSSLAFPENLEMQACASCRGSDDAVR